jgi:hypothetical protein
MQALAVHTLGFVGGGRLTIQGSDAEIALGASAIRSSCAGDPHVTFFTPQSVLYSAGPTVVRAYFHGVPHTCIDAALRTPCVTPNEYYPSLFYAAWSYAGGTPVIKGPLRANSSLETTADGIRVGYQTWLDSPLPTLDELMALTGAGALTGSTRQYALAIHHFAQSGEDSLAIPFRGLPDGDQISLTAHEPPSHPPDAPPLPPSPPPPFSPPPLPPPLLTTSVPVNGATLHHNRLASSPASTGGNAWSFSLLVSPATVTVQLWGAGGGGMTDETYSRIGGGGAYVSATFSSLAVNTPVFVRIGTGGGGHPDGNAPSGGLPGGGAGGNGPDAGGGGGCTIISTGDSPVSHANILALAGGGGGAGRWSGNAAGYPDGKTADAWDASTWAGKGGTQSAGGAGGSIGTQNNCGSNGERGSAGAALLGGDGGHSCIDHGGGGGGGCGYFGGGGGRGYSMQIGNGGGGGGSSFVDTVAGSIVQTHSGSWQTGGGETELAATPEAAGVAYGMGGDASFDGRDGFLVITVSHD